MTSSTVGLASVNDTGTLSLLTRARTPPKPLLSRWTTAPAIRLLADPDRQVIEAYDVWQEKKMCGRVSMGVVRTTYLIDENGVIAAADGKVKAADDAGKWLAYLGD